MKERERERERERKREDDTLAYSVHCNDHGVTECNIKSMHFRQ